MSLIYRLMSLQETGNRGPADDFWYTAIGSVSESGEMVSPESAMRVAAVYSCIRVLTETIASLPLILYKKNTTTGAKSRATEDPLYPILHHRPNAQMTSYDWRDVTVGFMSLRGNAYTRIFRDGAGQVTALVPLNPDRVKVELLPNGRLRYQYRNPMTKTIDILLQEDVLRTKIGGDALIGKSIIGQAANAIGLAQSAEKFGSKFFKNDARPGGILKTEGKLSDDAAKNLKVSWQNAHSGDGRGSVAILEEGLEWQTMSLTNEDAQFIEIRKYQRSEIASMFRVPPHMIGDLEHATFSNIEQQGIEFVMHSIRPWLVNLEQSFMRDLYPEREDLEVEFNVEGLLRGDSTSRAVFYSRAINDGYMTRNEVRQRENLNPLPGLDEPLVPLNMTTPSGANPDNLEDNRNQPRGPQKADRTKKVIALGGAIITSALTPPTRMFVGDYKKRTSLNAKENQKWFSEYKDSLGNFFSTSVANQLHGVYLMADKEQDIPMLNEKIDKAKALFISKCELVVTAEIKKEHLQEVSSKIIEETLNCLMEGI